MILFQLGDKIERVNKTEWWEEICLKYGLDPNGVYTVDYCDSRDLICVEWLNNGFKATPSNFTLISGNTKEEIIVARIKKLYSKCKTTAHWV